MVASALEASSVSPRQKGYSDTLPLYKNKKVEKRSDIQGPIRENYTYGEQE